ncbi:MAG TPA: muconolactone Delta-isomerase family protein [Jiangellaceae bacterium]
MTGARPPEFLVRIHIALPPDLDDDRRAALEHDEHRVGEELVRAGVIERIWRLPGQPANVGIWRAADATELHRHLRSLPMWRWMHIEVTALATHPLEADAD